MWQAKRRDSYRVEVYTSKSLLWLLKVIRMDKAPQDKTGIWSVRYYPSM